MLGIELHEARALLGSSHGSGQTKRISSYGNYALHAKITVFDRRQVFMGSMNFDQRSKRLNTEIGLIIDSPELAQQTALRFGGGMAAWKMHTRSSCATSAISFGKRGRAAKTVRVRPGAGTGRGTAKHVELPFVAAVPLNRESVTSRFADPLVSPSVDSYYI